MVERSEKSEIQISKEHTVMCFVVLYVHQELNIQVKLNDCKSGGVVRLP